MRKLFIVVLFPLAFSACKNNEAEKVSDLSAPRDTVQAISLMGDTLYLGAFNATAIKKYDSTKMAYEADPNSADNLIWYGRWAAYTGDHKTAIRIFSEGITRFPEDARMYRHRGHRYITIRNFDKAIADLEKAMALIAGKPDEVEPDGQPNAKNIPVSTLHSNILYHLALAYYLKNEPQKAIPVYERSLREAVNDDQRVSVMHWLYMTLRMQGEEKAAQKVVEPVNEQMDIIENTAYQRLCLMYKGVLPADSLLITKAGTSSNDAVLYGVANWYRYNNQQQEAVEVYEKILSGKVWASFGYIAAEADKQRYFPNNK